MSRFALLTSGANMALMLLWWITVLLDTWLAGKLRCKHGGRGHKKVVIVYCRAQPKTAWVTNEIIRLKALMPDAGCRSVANIFNRRFAASRRMTVGKSFVADTLLRHQYDIQVLRREIKHRVPRPAPRNLVWGLDLTGKGMLQGRYI